MHVRSAAILLAASLLLPRALCQEDSAGASGYNQPFRPQVHFSPQQHWTNDPNGLVFYRGEYHLFFQYNPFGDQWGHMSWGHAVSSDLLHWKQLPVAIPEANGIMIYTGSVVVDHDNSSGLCAPSTECLVAIYTGAINEPGHLRQNQNIAASQDNGRTWTPFSGNPVLDLNLEDFRDPSVSWNDLAHAWVMAVSLPKEHKVRFYSSPNLKDWKQLSDFGPAGDVDGDWECPDLLHIPSANGKGSGTWALKIGLNPGAPQGGSGEQYFLGDFNGTAFTASNKPGSHGLTNYGKDDYCAISYNGLPASAQPVLIGWMSNWQYAAKLPTSPWRGQMSLPRHLTLLSDAAGTTLRQEPITAPLRSHEAPIRATIHSAGDHELHLSQQAPYELDLHFQPGATKAFGIRLYADPKHWTEIGFDPANNQFYIDRTRSIASIAPEFSARTIAPLSPARPFDLRLIVDRSSVEAFAQNGTIAMTDLLFDPPGDRITLFSADQRPVSITGTSWQLNSIWK